MRFCYFGLVNYDKALELQLQAWEQTQEDGLSRILGFEHPAVVTLGKRGQVDKDISPEIQIPIYEIDRGGQATLHSQGQLVIYPIVNLSEQKMAVREFVELLHVVSENCLRHLGLKTQRQLDSGLYTENGKITFMGLRVDKGVTRHGLSINVSNNLDLFSKIRACGVASAKVDSLSKNGIQIPCRDLFASWIDEFSAKNLSRKQTPAISSSILDSTYQKSSLSVVGSALP